MLTTVNYKKNNENPQSIYINYNIQHQFVGCLKVVGAYTRHKVNTACFHPTPS